MSLIFVHLSDIHFGQEKGGSLHINDDVKERLLDDARTEVMKLSKQKADGVIISGDIAYGGKLIEYEIAGKWLDRLTAAVGCEITDVQVVPGNHDIDFDEITPITQSVIDEIIEKGDEALDKFLDREADRELIYRRFHGYRTFAEGYDCPLDSEGRVSKDHIFELAPNRRIKFLGLNTALICSKSEKEEGGLILGKRQHVIPIEPGLETIVIAHHPLNWIQDSNAAGRYIRKRARVFISGHEHMPSHKLEQTNEDADLVSLASGAAAPPKADDQYNYCYNILEFQWLEEEDALLLNIHGRMWDYDNVEFISDGNHFNNGLASYKIRCPNFRKEAGTEVNKISLQNIQHKCDEVSVNLDVKETPKEYSMGEEAEINLVLLKFFRDLTSGERLSLLIELGAIPNTWNETLTHGTERSAFNKLLAAGKLEQVHDKINQILHK
ncbi:metallophosphoesterase [Flavobacterium ginsengiterrae]|uniref:Metallophosphoesterase n=1 Tax=Flavobacterium ginsengiterrae TaxID=871695 RepID=A0ABP7GQB0_9FLAO